jgi:hypothetical protein
MFRCSYTIIRERINSCLLKLQLLKESSKIHRCVVNAVVVWLHILGPYWCMYVALFGSATYTHIAFSDNSLVHQVVNKYNIDNIKMHGTNVKKNGKVLRCKVVCLFSWRYNPLWLYFHGPVVGFSLLVFARFLDHTQRRATVGRSPLDE